jgi:creatinine amidohydrolase/Fe(II)-dependent formamide hydrolase-like protein
MLIASATSAQSLFIEDLTWLEVRDAIDKGSTTAIYYAGSTEQNGPHMAIGKHNFISHHVAEKVAAQLGNALVYPIMPYAPTGNTKLRTGHMRYPGSVSLSEDTFIAVARDVAASARAAGFKNILLMADHGEGQDALGQLARDLASQWKESGVRIFHISDLYGRSAQLEREFLTRHGLEAGGHAALADTASLMSIDRKRQWVRTNKIVAGDGKNGVDGDPARASVVIGDQLIELKVKSALAQIRRLIGTPGT